MSILVNVTQIKFEMAIGEEFLNQVKHNVIPSGGQCRVVWLDISNYLVSPLIKFQLKERFRHSTMMADCIGTWYEAFKIGA
jgi:hypothetical protein